MIDEKPKILLVDDESENLKALERTLRVRFEIAMAMDATQALALLEKEEFAVIISDQRMPGMLGTDLLAQVATKYPLMTRVILTAYTETKEILDSINRAAIYRYVTKPWDNQELLATIVQAAEHHGLLAQNHRLVRQLKDLNASLEVIVENRTQELRQVNEKLAELAMTDPLTKIPNRRAFFIRFHDEVARSRRYEHSLVVAMIDIDHFKVFNDMEGHVYGDEALRKAAQIFLSQIRRTDTVARYGGEEFIILMPETEINNALEICERLRAAVEGATFQGKNEAAYLTVSIGLSGYPGQGETPEDLVKAADQALYQAKQDGRNKVVYREQDESLFVR